MADYTEKVKLMFSDKAIEILVKNNINVSDTTAGYLLSLSEKEIQDLEAEILEWGKSGEVGKVRLTFRASQIRQKAKEWETKQSKANEQKEELAVEVETTITDSENDYSHLKGNKYHQKDLFILDNFDIVEYRDDIASMEHPIFALKAGDKRIVKTEYQDSILEITPNAKLGRATIFDKDVWIYAVSKMCQAMYEGKEVNREVDFNIYDFLKTTNRSTTGTDYKRAKESIARLRGTTITIEDKAKTKFATFGLIDMGAGERIFWEDGRTKKIRVKITLPDFLFSQVKGGRILKISPDYFRLRKPIDRRIYEIATKHAGKKLEWKISLKKLYDKTGATMTIEKFRFNIQSLVRTNELPDYIISYDKYYDMVTFILRNAESEQEREHRKNKALAQKFRVKKNKKIQISEEFLQRINQSVRYYPHLKNAGLLNEEFLQECLKQSNEEQILSTFEKCKQVNFDKINNPKGYFLKALEDGGQ